MKIALAFSTLLLLGACSGATGSSEEPSGDAPVAEVNTAVAQLGATDTTVNAFGVAEPGLGAQHAIVAGADAIVARIYTPTGTSVRAGQAVVALVPTPASRATIAKAHSDLVAANAAYARAKRLRADGLVSDAEVEAARSNAASASSLASNLGIGGGGSVLRAPVSGVVQGLTVRPGDQVAAGTTLASFTRQGDLRARLGVDPSVATRIHSGQPMTLALAGGSNTFGAIVSGVDPQIDATTHLASVFANVPQGLSVSAGEPLSATIQVGSTTQGITIPYAALLDDGGRSYVFVVKNGIAHEVDVQPADSRGEKVEIVKGLHPGDRVVTQGGTALEDGMKVQDTSEERKK